MVVKTIKSAMTLPHFAYVPEINGFNKDIFM